MPYEITMEPINRISGVKPKSVSIETASETWKEVDALMRSDEKVTIKAPEGYEIGWQELKRRADEEGSGKA